MSDATSGRPRRVSGGDDVVGEYEEKRSRFVAVLRRVDDEPAARDLVAELRRAHPDARHHCSAFRLPGPVAPVERSNDDGEPSGTAGAPMLEVLRGAGLVGVAVVVVRWFGGTKLGTGGLARAYAAAVTDAVRAATEAGRIVEVVEAPAWVTEVGHPVAGGLEAALRVLGARVLGVEHGARVRIRVAGELERLAPLLAERTSGGAVWAPDGTAVTEHRV